MSEPDAKTPNVYSRCASLALITALSLANSALFYFVIWDMFSPSEPYTVILFFVSGSAHLVYFFLPWFAASVLAPVFRVDGTGASHYSGGARSQAPQTDNFFVTICTQFGVALCITALVLWALQIDWHSDPGDGHLALITKENCLQIGGAPQYVDGRLTCVLAKGDIRAVTMTGGERRSGRI